MKIVYTKEEVAEIVLRHAQESINDDLNKVDISTYSEDFATLVIQPEPVSTEPVEEKPLDLSDIPF